MKNIPTVILSTILLAGCGTIQPGERGIKVELGVVKKKFWHQGYSF